MQASLESNQVIKTVWKSDLEFEAQTQNGRILISPSSPPEELLVLALASSSGIEVMKRNSMTDQKIDSFEISSQCKYKEKNGVLMINHIDLIFSFKGKCSPIIVTNAVEHSQFLSCGIAAILSRTITIGWFLKLNDENIADGMASFDYSLNDDSDDRTFDLRKSQSHN